MAATDVVVTRTRVAMVWPGSALVQRGVADLRGEPRDDAELVDQAHFGERLRVLGESGTWLYVQGEDQYLGWCDVRATVPIPSQVRTLRAVVALLADAHERRDRTSTVVARLPAGTLVTERQAARARALGGASTGTSEWIELFLAEGNPAFVATEDTIDLAEVPHRCPNVADLLATAEFFLGVPYLWGGTTALGLDCSGFVQQVYRLNGVALPRDADQQAMLGRPVTEPRGGDLLFFGAETVTHVALSTGGDAFIHAPKTGGFVERAQVGGDRRLLSIRRYLPDVSMGERR